MGAHHHINYDRILPYRGSDEKLQSEFANIYIESFNDPDGAYGESNTLESVISEVWHHHIDNGRISVAMDGANNSLVGLACLELMDKASEEEYSHSEVVFDYLKSENIHKASLPVWYFSELAVTAGYRNRDDHIGTSLIDLALQDLRCRNSNGDFGHDDKAFILTRTDLNKSMSVNAFKRAGFVFLDKVVQYAKDSTQVTKHDSKSLQKIWGYKVVYPICCW